MKNSRDILIKDGLIYDGSGSEPYISDIAISDDKIQFIGSTRKIDGGLIIDAKGLAVSPGFIDTHGHSDFTLIADPRAVGKICQGITTEINGNCGMSSAPLYDKALERREDDLNELGISERWNTLKEYFDIIERKGIAVNIATLAGHGNIRGSVIGYEDKLPSDTELSGMSRLLKNTLEQGAIGLSTGLIYPPGIYSETEELVGLSKTLHDSDLIYTSHMRSEGSRLVEAVEEVIRIGIETGIKVHISHIKTAGQGNWGKADSVISMLDVSLRSGGRITCDSYPYTASSTDLDSILPSWAFEGGNEEEIRRLIDGTERDKIADELMEQSGHGDYWKKIMISSVTSEKNRWMEGKTIAEISRGLKMDEIDLVLKILLEEKLRIGAIFFSMCEENLHKFLSLQYCMIGSDSSARSFDGMTRKGRPHPRGFGTFPRILGKYVRDVPLLSLPDAIRKSSMLAAKTFGLRGRGQIKEGMYADIVVFDPEKIIDKATFDNPFQRPEGIYFVLVNGTPAIWEGTVTGKLAGKVLRGK